LAHAIRLLLEYTETPYEDKLYSCGEAPDYDKSQWLPYFIDGTTKLTQSNAIMRYIARKHKMSSPLHPFLPQEKLKPGYLEQLPGKLKLFSNFLGDRKWFAGEK
ncbi:PREDICTED: glutathione S-transferase Mu 3-like, partial [Fulmarus glacialis]|uniref:glutathione S-transferase Mu 3-like n=1 Tax=Fulmarus glacialis TaxID=30455 RepID=UPI00051B6C19